MYVLYTYVRKYTHTHTHTHTHLQGKMPQLIAGVRDISTDFGSCCWRMQEQTYSQEACLNKWLYMSCFDMLKFWFEQWQYALASASPSHRPSLISWAKFRLRISALHVVDTIQHKNGHIMHCACDVVKKQHVRWGNEARKCRGHHLKTSSYPRFLFMIRSRLVGISTALSISAVLDGNTPARPEPLPLTPR